MKKLIPILFLLAACATGPDTAKLIDAQCVTATSGMNIMTALKAQNKLSEQNIKDVDAAKAVINPICSATERPTGTEYLTSLQMAILQLHNVQTNLGK